VAERGEKRKGDQEMPDLSPRISSLVRRTETTRGLYRTRKTAARITKKMPAKDQRDAALWGEKLFAKGGRFHRAEERDEVLDEPRHARLSGATGSNGDVTPNQPVKIRAEGETAVLGYHPGRRGPLGS